MNKISSAVELKAAIDLLGKKQHHEEQLLREEVKATIEQLKPMNLIRKQINEFINVPRANSDVLSTAVGMGAGYLSKKLTTGNSHNPVKKLLGVLLQVGVTSLVSKNSVAINVAAGLIGRMITRKKK
jgi:hypothetical protein